ncbi:MAG: hypothetical protein RIQ62_1580 [Bacteroidota bacterium]|jgi:hypothetical protein
MKKIEQKHIKRAWVVFGAVSLFFLVILGLDFGHIFGAAILGAMFAAFYLMAAAGKNPLVNGLRTMFITGDIFGEEDFSKRKEEQEETKKE